MNKQDLEIAKKIAEIEGLSECDQFHHDDCNGYNPFGWSILGPLMVKYEVSIESACEYVFISQGWSEVCIHFRGKEEIPHAILECIIKSKED